MKQLANSIPPIHHIAKRGKQYMTPQKKEKYGEANVFWRMKSTTILHPANKQTTVSLLRGKTVEKTRFPEKFSNLWQKNFLMVGIVRLAKISTYREGKVHYSPTRCGGGGGIPQTSSTAAGPPVKTISLSIWENDVASSYIRLQMQSTLSASKRRESV